MKLKNYTYFILTLLYMPTLFGAARSSYNQPVSTRPRPISSLQESALRTIIKDITPQQLQTIQTADDLYALISSMISPEQLKNLRNTGLYTMIFNHLAQMVAKDHFLRLSPEKEGRKAELLPAWLREHFTGISIQNLVDYGTDFESLTNWGLSNKTLKLNNMYINSFTGLENIPGITSYSELDVSDNQITSIEPGIFNHLKYLQDLNLSGNRITYLELGVFSGLSQLRYINLGHNYITSLEFGVFTGLSALQVLTLSGNRISSLASGAFSNLPLLEELNLSHNQIISFESDVLIGLSTLKHLVLKHNKIVSIEPDVFIHVPQLEGLNLANNLISIIQPAAFAGLKRVHFIWLQNNPIAQNEEERARIAEEVKKATNGRGWVLWEWEEE